MGSESAGGGPPAEDSSPIEARLVSAAEAQAALRGPQWLHPTSVIFGLLSTLRQFAVAAVVGIFLASTGNRVALAAAGVGVLLTAVAAVFRYFTLRYQLAEGELRIDEGLVFKRHRTIPASRIQNIDLVQNPLHHWLGVAEVSIETAGGSEPEAKLRVLGLEDVELLRAAIFGRAAADRAGEEGDEADASPRDPAATGSSTDRLVHAISVRQLVLAGLISNRGFLLIPILLGVFFQFDLEERFDVDQVERYLPATVTWQQTALWTTAGVLLLLVLLRTFSIGWFLWRFYGHRVERHGDDLRVACGLFTRVSATVPRRRIQFISVQQTWLGRWAGLAVIRLETAGGAGKQGEEAKESVARRWFVPAIRSTDVPAVLAELRPGLEFDPRALPWHATSPRTARRLTRLAVLKAALIAALCGLVAWELALGVGVGMLVALVWHARRYARSLRYAGTDRWVVFRSGILTRKVSIAFFDKIQAVAISQTPFDRRWGMSTLRVDTAAAGPAQHRIEVKYLPSDVAADEAARVAWQASRYQLDPQGV